MLAGTVNSTVPILLSDRQITVSLGNYLDGDGGFTCPRAIFHNPDGQLAQSECLALRGRNEVDGNLGNLARHVGTFCFNACHVAVFVIYWKARFFTTAFREI